MTIGEFSRRSGLSARLLRTYAGLGLLVPSAVDPASGYRHYDAEQLDDGAIVVGLRQAGVPVADLKRFLNDPFPEALARWERLLVAEAHARRQALVDVRARLGMGSVPTRGATVIDIRPVEDRTELRGVFDLICAELAEPIDSGDVRFRDLDSSFPQTRRSWWWPRPRAGRRRARIPHRRRLGDGAAHAVRAVPSPRRRSPPRRADRERGPRPRRPGVALGTDEAVGFWFHLGYTPNLLFQWVHDADLSEQESEVVLGGPATGLSHWRSSYDGVPQLFVELDEPRLDLRNTVRQLVDGCHVGFMMHKALAGDWRGRRRPGATARGRPATRAAGRRSGRSAAGDRPASAGDPG